VYSFEGPPHTSSAWKVGHMHGTTLERKRPVWSTEDDSSFQQRGFAFLTPESLVVAWMEKKGQHGDQRKRKFDEFAEDLFFLKEIESLLVEHSNKQIEVGMMTQWLFKPEFLHC
jgi:hypothetical protein